jgi:regulator of sigma E protease
MRVEKFSIGFPPKVVGKKFGETEYVLGLTPLGGYVKISGMVDESMDTEELNSEPQPWEFRAKPVWQRSVVITAGVVFNMILAAVVFIALNAFYGFTVPLAEGPIVVAEESIAYEMGLRTGDVVRSVNGETQAANDRLTKLDAILKAEDFVVEVDRSGETFSFNGPEDIMTRLNRSSGLFGITFNAPVIGAVATGRGAEEVGILPGDKIVSLAGQPVAFFSDMASILVETGGDNVVVRFRRPDSLASSVPANARVVQGATGSGILYEANLQPSLDGDRYVIGVSSYVKLQRNSPVQAIGAGLSETWTNTSVIVTSLGRLFTGRENFRENIGGPIMIAKVTKAAADRGAYFFWNIVAMLSITLAIINILPIPALDGGHLVFLIYEGIVRREPSLKLRMVLQQIGMVLLFAFMAFVIFNDILKL